MSESGANERPQRGRPFKQGQSGNPVGRPAGSRNRATLAAEALLEGQAEALTSKAIEMALDGDLTALRICMDRIVPVRRERLIRVDLPPLSVAADGVKAHAAVVVAVAEGTITLGEAAELSRFIDNVVKSIAAREFDERLRDVETDDQ